MKFLIDKLHQLYDWVIKWADRKHNTKVLCGLAFFEASIFPLPVDPLLLAMGFGKPKSSFYYAFLATTFSVLGAIAGYHLGLYLWQFSSPFFFDYVFSQEKFDMVADNLKGATFLSIFIAGFSPIPFKIFTIAGGVVSAPLLPFIAASILSRGLRYFILGGLVFFMGEQIKDWIDKNFDKLTIWISLILVLIFSIYIFLF